MLAKEIKKLLQSSKKYKEIYLEGSNGQSLHVLINGQVGWLMYFGHNADAGFSSRNPKIDSNEEIEFYLDNGQKDLYPKNWTYPITVIEQAMLNFIQDSQLPSNIEWNDDSILLEF